ncbi:MAG: DUF1684 domain-containing protein [Candidatus Dormibacteria bacterium]
MPEPNEAPLELLDWRRRVADLYADIRREPHPEVAWARWRDVRADLFTRHPQSPYGANRGAATAPYLYAYDPRLRVRGVVTPAAAARLELPGSGPDTHGATRVGRVEFALNGEGLALGVYWLHGYSGGLFLPFSDATSGTETYGAGRYLLDTAKAADLGGDGHGLVLDFNFAFHPSCAHDPRWSCPLTPPENRLGLPIRGGERLSQAPHAVP